jgi:hypothetical protein
MRSRVSESASIVISFLVRYSREQQAYRRVTGAYEKKLVPDIRFSNDDALFQSYSAVRLQTYECDFTVRRSEFAVSCRPYRDSGLLLSFFVDQTNVVRMASGERAGGDSAELRLSERERELMILKMDLSRDRNSLR